MSRQQKMIRQPSAAEEAMKQEAFTTMRSARTVSGRTCHAVGDHSGT